MSRHQSWRRGPRQSILGRVGSGFLQQALTSSLAVGLGIGQGVTRMGRKLGVAREVS